VSGIRHLYVHLPFCAHRCGYCDFVTVVGRPGEHGGYVDALLAELDLERGLLAADAETVFLGGGTPTFTEERHLRRLLDGLPRASVMTIEANPETVTPGLAVLLRECGVNRVSLGAQTFDPALLAVLERHAGPDDVRRAFSYLRDAGFENISLDLIYGIPGQSAAGLEADLDAALGLGPDHLSCYELEAKAGTRFTHGHGAELARQADALEGYFERVVERLTGAGYRWYETANFCLPAASVGGRDLRAHHNLAYWLGRDYLGVGIGAVSTVGGLRWRNTPKLPLYVRSLADRARPPRDLEELPAETRGQERVMLGLRLDDPFQLNGEADLLDDRAVERLARHGLVERRGDELTLTRRGRLLGDGVTAELLN